MRNGFLCLVTMLLSIQYSWANQKKMKIAFLIEHLFVRGTEIATFDYADYNESILGNESFIVLLHEGNPRNQSNDYSPEVEDLFVKRFGADHFFDCHTVEEADRILKQQKIDILYWLANGGKDNRIAQFSIKTAIHAVFDFVPQGNAFAAVSQWLSSSNPRYNNIPTVPHIVRLPQNLYSTLHDQLQLPHNAIVFGRHGGYNEFNIDFAQKTVIKLATKHPDWYFLFLNTHKFCELPNVIHLEKTWDFDFKERFINTCDAMLHAGASGETFGLSCAEFSIRNKPVITYRLGHGKAHLDLLKNKALLYSSKEELVNHLEYCASHRTEIRSQNWDAYSENYNPWSVMQQFNKVFVEPLR